MSDSITRVVLHLAVMAAVVYAALVLLAYVFQSRLLYFPEVGREVISTPRTAGLDFEEVWLDFASNARVHGWFVSRKEPLGTVLIFHGNAGSIALRIDWLRMFHELGYSSFIIDYRGYGRSTGSPTEHGTYDDAFAAWRYLTTVKGIAAKDIAVLGESLGGAIAATVAARESPRALIVQSAFTSIPAVARDVYPILPLRWISRFDYNTLERIREVNAPVLIAHSPQDEIIGYHHGRALFDAASSRKHFMELAGGHNDAYIFTRREWINALAVFLDTAKANAASGAGERPAAVGK